MRRKEEAEQGEGGKETEVYTDWKQINIAEDVAFRSAYVINCMQRSPLNGK